MKSGDKTKIVINDKTLLAKPDDMDYTFQYYDDADQPVTPLSDLLKDDASKEDNITVCAKVVKVSDPKNAVTQQSRGNTSGYNSNYDVRSLEWANCSSANRLCVSIHIIIDQLLEWF